MKIKKGYFIVSCQALEDEPLYSSFIMGRMALAAMQGGADAIRANSIEDIREIKKNVPLPIIGIIKKDYVDSEVYITPTINEIDQLVSEGVDVIALDATNRIRPNGIKLETLFKECKSKYPDQEFMADCATIDDVKRAEELGFTYIGTTLFGYTDESKEHAFLNNYELFKKVLKTTSLPIIAEGNVSTPKEASDIFKLGAYGVVVGGAITRPKSITEKFINEIEEKDGKS